MPPLRTLFNSERDIPLAADLGVMRAPMNLTAVRHLAVAIAVTIILVSMRGGWLDMPAVLVVFAALGFSASLLTSKVFINWVDAVLGRSPLSLLLRYAAVLTCLLLTLRFSGTVLIQASYGMVLFLLLLAFFLPLVTSLLSPHASVLFGALSGACIVVSLWIAVLQLPYVRGSTGRDPRDEALFGLVVVAFSSIIVLPVHMARRAA